MGIVRMGPPIDLMLKLKQMFQIDVFVESGTYLGGTAMWAASVFDRVITIEASKNLYERAKTLYAEVKNIEFLFGDSRSVLPLVIQSLDLPAFLWLDSHWSGETTHGRNYECPLLEEIRIVNTSEHANFLFIDDARLFMSPPPEPHDWNQWPSIEEVIQTMQGVGKRYHAVIIDDVLIAAPNAAKDALNMLCRELNTKSWKDCVVRDGKPCRSGSRLIAEGVRLVGRGVLRKLRRG